MVQLDLMEFIESKILPRYNEFDPAHQLSHARRVIDRSLRLARQFGADPDMAYVVAAYHDLGLEGPRAIHHLTSGKILKADHRLTKWFSPAQIEMMKEAVEDHRASASHAPRNLYGKIVAEADRDLSPDTVFSRAVMYGLKHYPELVLEEQWERFYEHMQEKYSVNGYIKLWIPGSDSERELREVQRIIEHPEELRRAFDKAYTELTRA